MSFFSDPLGSIGGTLSSAGLGSIGNGLTNLSKSFGNQSFAEKALELAALGVGGYAAMGGGLADLIPSFGDTAIPGGAPVTDLSTSAGATQGAAATPEMLDNAQVQSGAIGATSGGATAGTAGAGLLSNPYVKGALALGGGYLLAQKPKTNFPNPQTTPVMGFTGAGGVHYPTRPSGFAVGGMLPANPNAPMAHDVSPQYINPTSTPVAHPVMHLASGGISDLGSYSDGGRMLKGPGDGMSDSIPATINNHQPARLANDEFVVPADVVSHLGNGSSDAGAKKLYSMMDRVRRARTGTPKQAKAIHPDRYIPA